MSFRKAAVEGVKWTFVGTIGRILFQLLQISILTRYLPKEAFGLVAMALVIIQFSNIFIDMGMSSAILHRQNATNYEYSSIYWLNIFISIILYGLLYLGTPFFASFYEEPELLLLIPVLGVNLLLMAIGRQHRTIMQKHFKFKAITVTELISFFIGLITAVTLAINDFVVYSLVYSTLIASFISNILFLTLNLKSNPISLYFRFNEVKPFFKVGSFAMGSSLLDFFSREIDIIIIGKMLGAESLGIYSLAKQIVIKLYGIVNPIIVNVLSPVLSSLQSNKTKLKTYYLNVVNFLATINFPVYLLLIVLSKEILEVVYGMDYVPGYWVLSFLAISYVMNTIGNPVGSLQIATGRTDLGLKWTIFRLLITPGVILIAANHSINVVAAAIGGLSIVFIVPLWWIQIRPMVNISLIEYLKQFLKPSLLFFSIIVGFYLCSQCYVLSFGLIINSLIKGFIAMCSYFGLLWLIDSERIKGVYYLILSRNKPN